MAMNVNFLDVFLYSDGLNLHSLGSTIWIDYLFLTIVPFQRIKILQIEFEILPSFLVIVVVDVKLH